MNKLLFVTTVLAVIGGTFSEKLLLCYYGSWATYRNSNGASHVQDLDPFICSHLIYTFVGLNEDASIRIMDPWLELPENWGRDNFGQFNKLKTINPKLKTIVAIGGWNEGSARYSKVANDATLRATFAKNAADFTVKYGFDGFDLDWEYPGQRDSAAGSADIGAHALLLQVMRQEFDKQGLLLTAAVASVKSSAQLSYDIPALGKYLDFIHVMTYDLHGAWEKTTGHNANLRQYETSVAAADSFDVETAINYWLSNGAPKEKLIMGLPLYGRTFSLTNPADTSVGAPSSGAGIAGQYSYENGMIGLNELCEKQMTQSWPEKWDEAAQVPYTSSGKDWISYDNHKSLALKAAFALSKELAGVMVWSIETDDFKGICHTEKFAYLRTINKAIGRTVGSATTVTPAVTTTTTTTTTTQSPTAATTTTTKATTDATTTTTTTASPGSSTTDSINSVCTKEGYVRDTNNCAIFYQCVWMGSSWKAYQFTCASPLLFDIALHICNYPAQVSC